MRTWPPAVVEAIAVVLGVGMLAVLGQWWQAPMLMPTIGLFVYLGWHLFQIQRFRNWMQDPKACPIPRAVGLWRDLPDAVMRLRQKEKKRKRKLHRTLSGFEDYIRALPDGTVVLNDRWNVVWWNQAAIRYLGLRSVHRDQSIVSLIDDPAFRAYVEKADFTHPMHLPSPVNNEVILEVRLVPYGDGKHLLQARDISRLMQLETVRRDFVANVSHEMRTPLTVIHGYLETMSDSVDEGLAPWLPIIRQMNQQSSRMRRVVEDLLLLSRIENNDDARSREVVQVPVLLKAISEEAKGLSGDDSHRILLDIDEDLLLLGNAAELESAFSNLVSNAVRYTPPNGVIHLIWRREAGGARFSVRDTGIGIAAEHLPRLTERFYRVDVGRSREKGGTGLGLAIVKHVLMRNAGRLEIDSEPGVGSVFSCVFPESLLVPADLDPAPVACDR